MSGRRILALVPAFDPDPEALRRTLDSLLAQTVRTDICIIDDGSAIPVPHLLGGMAKIICLRLDCNGGITHALRSGVRYGVGAGYAYFCRLDVGDTSYPHRVARQFAHLEGNPAIDLVGAFSKVCDLSGKRIGLHGTSGGPHRVKAYLRKNAAFKHSTFFMRASALERYGNYDPAYDAAEDYELALRLARKGAVDCLPDILIDYVDDPSGISTTRRRQQLKSRLKAQMKYADPGDPLCHLGLARTIALMAMPTGVAKKLSLRRWRAAMPAHGS